MVTENRIAVGCRVQAKVGPFIHDERTLSSRSSGNDPEEPSSKRKRASRRIRTVFHGTVVSSTADQHWRVHWDDIGKTSDHTRANLRVLSTSTVPDADLVLLESWNSNQEIYIGNHQELLMYTKDMRLSTENSRNTVSASSNNVAVNVNVATAREPVVFSPPPPLQPPPANDQDTSTETATETNQDLPPLEDNCDSDDEDDEDLIDAKELQQQFLREEKTNKYLEMKFTYMSEKAALIHSKKTIDVKGPLQLVTTWTIVGDVKQADVPLRRETHETRGVSGFDFNNKTVKSDKGTKGRVNFHEMFMHLWGDDDNDENLLTNMNKYLNQANQDDYPKNTRSLPTKVKPFTRKEFWIGWGLILSARVLNLKSGENMWKKKNKTSEVTLTNLIDAFDPRPYMTLTRFRQWKNAVSWIYADETLKDEDPWWRIINAINCWNSNRSRTICAGTTTVLDETISAFRPQTTATGNLPHLSYIQRKPEPLGTELKVSMCSELQVLKHLYLCRKKNDKSSVSEFENKTKKKTALVSLELMKKTCMSESENELFLGDAWFSSIELAVLTATNLHAHYIGVVKTNHSRYPRKYLKQVMDKWPGGSYLNLTTTIDGVKLYATGYKYCNRKALNFLWTDGAGSTEPGSPYEAVWMDSNGNRSVRFIERPSVVSCYFERSNGIDVSNQMRQFELKLEKVWKTNCGYFRLLTTLIGCNVVDCWRLYRHHCRPQHRHKHISLLDFTSMLAYDMLHNNITDEVDLCNNINVLMNQHNNNRADSTSTVPSCSTPPSLNSTPDSSTTASVQPTSHPPSISGNGILDGFAQFCLNRELLQEEMRKRHQLVSTTDIEQDNSIAKGYRQRRALCIAPGCKKKTSTYCSECICGNRDHFWVCKNHHEWHTQKYMQQPPFKHS